MPCPQTKTQRRQILMTLPRISPETTLFYEAKRVFIRISISWTETHVAESFSESSVPQQRLHVCVHVCVGRVRADEGP